MIEVHDRSVAYGHGGLQVIGFFKYQSADQLGSKQLTLMPLTGSSPALEGQATMVGSHVQLRTACAGASFAYGIGRDVGWERPTARNDLELLSPLLDRGAPRCPAGRPTPDTG